MESINLALLESLYTDWSGVKSDDRLPVYEVNMQMFESRGLKRLSFSDWLSITKASPREIMAAQGVHENPEALMQEYAERYGNIVRGGLEPTAYPDAKAFMECMVGIELRESVISSHPATHLVREAHHYGLAPFVDTFIGSVKDKAWELLRLLSRKGVSPNRAAYIGDMIFDIRAARGAGMIAIGITTGYQTRAQLEYAEPDIIVDSLSELAEMFLHAHHVA